MPSPYFAIPRVSVVFRRGPGLVAFSARDSAELFRRLNRAALVGDEIAYFEQNGESMAPESVAALNCYLRHHTEVERLIGATRFGWADFCAHLGLRFAAVAA